ncbi:Acetyltransferase (GNAT) domain-containing protein [Mameliella alba]|uniref:GNAT family N-acetyltransferase n=2 Tax=Mameliella alba TaxID=561184 RepID=UPI00088B2AC0|nr:GNAT family N-acetyltransferase [Mameliella alba]PTR41565.1 acetyltransferase (GNAT) family protein [Mameliella alba]GGF52585.1 acetyltransferase [Mameliella alba]SDC37985.1 Acetyltransferase (GNAT) domain-containing protein [Mameliella alba]
MRLMSLMSLLLPLPQSKEFARSCDLLGRPLRRCRNDGGLVWQVQSRRIGPLGRLDLVSRGPVAAHPDDLGNWLRDWARWHDGRPLVLNADGLSAGALRGAGFWPLVTPATLALLPLGTEAGMRAALAQKWRNRLKRAERFGLTLRETDLTPDHWILTAEGVQARTRGYKGFPPAFSAAFAQANPGAARVFEALDKGRPVAGALMLRHGRMATWQIGVTTPEGRRCHAMNLLLWRAMQTLSARGHDCLDLGILNTQDAPGVTHFKLGTGARAHRLGGTWLHMGALAPLARRLPLRMAA